MFNDGLPIASSTYSAKLEHFNQDLVLEFSDLTHDLKAKEPLLYSYYEMLLEAQVLGKLGASVIELTQSTKYLEAFTVCRNLFERVFHFKAASNFSEQLVYQKAKSAEDANALVARFSNYTIHDCATTKSESPQVCLELRISGLSVNRNPMARFYIAQGSGLLAHEFPNDYRQLLWSFVDEDVIVADNQWSRRHYTSFEAAVKTMTAIGIMNRPEKAKLQSHYGFLSAIAHAPFGIVRELHGHNREIGSFYGPTNRLIHLYVSSCLLTVLESLLVWMIDYDYFPEGKIAKIQNLLVAKEQIASELGFPFSPDHEFDDWQRSLPKLASENHEEDFLDLSKEFLDPDYLARILNINTQTAEYSVGLTWNPTNLFGIDS
jgi:hypothetical protein